MKEYVLSSKEKTTQYCFPFYKLSISTKFLSH